MAEGLTAVRHPADLCKMALENKLEACMLKIRAMRVTYPNDDEVKCRNCTSPIGCTSYRPYSPQSQLVITKGIFAYYNGLGGKK